MLATIIAISSLSIAFEDSFAQTPVSDAGPDRTVASGATVTLDGSGSTPISNSIDHQWFQTVGPAVLPANTQLAQITFTAPTGPATLTFILRVANFSTNEVARDTVTITVSAPPNQPPTANAGRDRTFAPESTVTLSGSGTDPDGNDNNLIYTWEQTSGTPKVTINDKMSARTTFTAPPDPTELVFTLTVDDRTDTTTDDITITIKERIQTRNIKEMSDTLISATITAPNEITMIYNEELSTFINSYLNFTISSEDKPRNITGINGSPAIETGETVRINGKQVKTYSTTLTFDGEPVPAGSTGTMYMQHADHYLALIQVSDGQN